MQNKQDEIRNMAYDIGLIVSDIKCDLNKEVIMSIVLCYDAIMQQLEGIEVNKAGNYNER
jgi:hypothetical protein